MYFCFVSFSPPPYFNIQADFSVPSSALHLQTEVTFRGWIPAFCPCRGCWWKGRSGGGCSNSHASQCIPAGRQREQHIASCSCIHTRIQEPVNWGGMRKVLVAFSIRDLFNIALINCALLWPWDLQLSFVNVVLSSHKPTSPGGSRTCARCSLCSCSPPSGWVTHIFQLNSEQAQVFPRCPPGYLTWAQSRNVLNNVWGLWRHW